MLPAGIIYLGDVAISGEYVEVWDLMRAKFIAEAVDKAIPKKTKPSIWSRIRQKI